MDAAGARAPAKGAAPRHGLRTSCNAGRRDSGSRAGGAVVSGAREQAIAQLASVADLVAALECDYDRLQELRDERSGWDSRAEGMSWEQSDPRGAEELAELEEAAGDCESADEARERILKDALSVEVRTGWHTPGESGEPDEFRVVLCTGGPHVEFVGDLDRGEPSRVRCLFRDWGESGELFDFDHDAALTYCRQFYFGE